MFLEYILVKAAWACRRVEQQWPFGCLPVAVLTASAPSAAGPLLSFLSDQQLPDKWPQLSLASPAQNDCHKVDK